MFSSLAGRVVVVTGASKGIGKGIARVFAKSGCKVLVVARHFVGAEETAAEFRAAGWTAKAHAGDVTSLADMEATMARAVSEFGALDIVCANAGIFPQIKIEEMSPETWDEVMATNLRGTFNTVKAAIPHLKASSQGRVILTSSITGPMTGFPGWTHYGASKAGQLGFMRTAAMELAKYKITVNAVLPGNIKTEGLTGLGPDYERGMAAAIPLGKLGTVEDIGYAALFFATAEASFVTGHAMVIDGGQILPESQDALSQI